MNRKSGDYLPDEKNPKFMFNMTDTDILLAIINGEIDAVEEAKQQLMARGLGADGKFIGFKKSVEHWTKG